MRRKLITLLAGNEHEQSQMTACGSSVRADLIRTFFRYIRRVITRYIIIPAVLAISIASIFYLFPLTSALHSLLDCGTAVYSSQDIIGTAWIIETRGTACYLGGSSPLDITARNVKTREEVVLARGEVNLASITTTEHEVVIHLPNLSSVTAINNKFGSIRVTYEYQPHDDPADRAMYQRWVVNRQAPENRAWWCKTVFAHMPHDSQELWNRVLAPSPDGIGKSSPSYCPVPGVP
jgi:hypothetical protein